MHESVQGAAVLRKFITIQSHVKRKKGIRLKKPHRDATQGHLGVALNRYNFCYNTLFLSAGFSESIKVSCGNYSIIKFCIGVDQVI